MATKQTVRYSSFKEAYWAFKNRQDLDRTNPFYKALLKVLEEDAQKEADGVKVDPGTVFPEACRRVEMYARTVDAENIAKELVP